MQKNSLVATCCAIILSTNIMAANADDVTTFPRLNQTNAFKSELEQAYTNTCAKAQSRQMCLDHLKMGIGKPDSHAPIGIMGDHLHKTGNWMVSYRYNQQNYSGIRNGTKKVDNHQLLKSYGEVPKEMTMKMHMFEIMYGINDKLTLMLMPQYMEMDMNHLSHGGHASHEHSISGIGDTTFMGLYAIDKIQQLDQNAKLHLNLGLSLPTGSTDEKFMNHHKETYNLPYNMQLGSGTFDPIIGATYLYNFTNLSIGAQTLNYIRIGKNDEGYRQGNKYTGNIWAAHNLTDFASLSLRIDGQTWGNVKGEDKTLPQKAIVGANPNEQAGSRIMTHIGLNLLAGKKQGLLSGNRLAAEFGLPLYEHYEGPQPKTKYQFTLGWQLAF